MNLKHSTGISRKLARQLLICFLPLILIGCGRAEPSPNERSVGRAGGDRTLQLGGLGGRPGPINPLVNNRTISANLADLVFNMLVRINHRMMPEPDLAESWQVSPDGLTYTFYLRQGVKFHDGAEFTADDCAFTYNAVLDPANDSPWRDSYNIIAECRAQDRYTFMIMLKEPRASFINLMWLPIVPKHLLSGSPLRNAEFNKHPVGTGPFRFRERTADERIILEANPDYYEGRPLVDRIEARGYDDFSQYFSGFMTGRIDMIQFLNTEQFETLARDPGFRACSFPSIYTYMIDYNPGHPIFADEKVRRALAHGINIPEIINKVENGLGIQSTGPFIPGAWFSDPDVKPLEYNPALALKILKDERWEMRPARTTDVVQSGGDDRILEKDGQPFRFTLLVDPKERITQTIAKIIYQDLYKIGIRCDIKPYDHSKQDKELVASAGAAVISFMILPNLEPSWHSNKQQQLGTLWRHLNPEIDRLFEQANITQDFKQRQALYHKLHRLVYAGQSGTFLYNLPNLGAVRTRFGNTDKLFSANMPFYTIKDWKTRDDR